MLTEVDWDLLDGKEQEREREREKREREREIPIQLVGLEPDSETNRSDSESRVLKLGF